MLLKSKDLVEQLTGTIQSKVRSWKEQQVEPVLCTFLVKGDSASEYYAKSKEKLARKLGVAFLLKVFDADITEEELLAEIGRANADPSIHGIMLELPMPASIRVDKLVEAIAPQKDVDGLTPANQLACFTGKQGLYPATPQSCIRILQHFNFPLKGKHVVLIGRGETVGRPLMQMLLRENATLTVCHSHTDDLKSHISQADILITAVGKANLVSEDMVHENLVVVDAGINEIADGAGITGDVAGDAAKRVQAMTPVPGGVGSLTTVILFENLLKAVQRQIVANKEGQYEF